MAEIAAQMALAFIPAICGLGIGVLCLVPAAVLVFLVITFILVITPMTARAG
jgi:hypothetical protein